LCHCVYIFAVSIIHFQKHTNSVRIGIVHNVEVAETVSPSSDQFLISRAIDVALDTLDVGVAKIFVTKLVKEENVEALKSGAKTLEDFSVSVCTAFRCVAFLSE